MATEESQDINIEALNSPKRASIVKKARREVLRSALEFAQLAGWTIGAGFLGEVIAERLFNASADSAKTETDPTTGEKKYPASSIEYKTLDPLTIHGVEVDTVGVSHISETFFAHQEDIKKRIAQSGGFIFMEYFDKYVQKAAESDIPDEQLGQGEGYDPDVTAFFALVARECARQEKPVDILIANPETWQNQAILFGVLLGIPAAKVITYGAEEITNAAFKKNILQIRGGRRELFKKAATFFGVAQLLDFIVSGLQVNQSKDIQETATVLAYGEIDYRNVRTASGIDHAIQVLRSRGELAEGATIPLFQGAGHGPTRGYLEDSTLREAKAATYVPYIATGDNTVRRFHYDKDQNKWVLLEQMPF